HRQSYDNSYNEGNLRIYGINVEIYWNAYTLIIYDRDVKKTQKQPIKFQKEISNQAPNFVVFSIDEKKICACFDEVVKIWDIETGELLTDLRVDRGKADTDRIGFPTNYRQINNAFFSLNGEKIYLKHSNLGYLNDKWTIWDIETGRFIKDSTEIKKKRCDSFSPSSKICLEITGEIMTTYNSETNKWLANLQGHKGNVNAASFSQDGRKVVSASNDKTVKIWDAETGRLLADLQGHTAEVRSATFSADGRKVVSVSSDNTVKIWTIDIPTIIKMYEDKIDELSKEEKEKYGVE
ncbi:MAG: WD40 repeat domain-containing protein, partial [Bacteroidia bacterium]